MKLLSLAKTEVEIIANKNSFGFSSFGTQCKVDPNGIYKVIFISRVCLIGLVSTQKMYFLAH